MSHPYRLRSMNTHITEGHPSGAGAARSLAPLELAEETESYHSDENRTAGVASHPSQLSTTTAANPEAVEKPTVTSSSTASHGEVDNECPSKVWAHSLFIFLWKTWCRTYNECTSDTKTKVCKFAVHNFQCTVLMTCVKFDLLIYSSVLVEKDSV